MPAEFAIATPERAATAAGIAAFEAGGNAIDAALAAAATLTVTYPHNCGVGGDMFALVRTPGGVVTSINASGRAPVLASAARMRLLGDRMPTVGVAPITVPGVVAGWERLHGLGAARPWPEMFAAAVGHAESGFEVPTSLAAAIVEAAGDIDADPGMRSVFRPDGRALRAGDRLQLPALARTLRSLATDGPRAFYEGRVGHQLVTGLEPLGALLRARDLAGFTPELTEPLIGRFRDLEILTSPPNSSGVVLLQALAAIDMAGDRLDPLGRDAAFAAEVLRLGAQQRDGALADPRAVRFDQDAFLGRRRIEELVARGRELGDRESVALGDRAPGGDTVAIVAADASGRAVSLIQSLFHAFGARVLEPETGVLLHNRGAFFSLEQGHPNELGPRKRPAHTLMPVMVRRGGRLAGVLGAMGGKAHAQIHTQLLLRLLAGDAARTAVSASRWVVGSLELGEPDDTVRIEAGVSAAARESLERSMPTVDVPLHSEELGHAQAIWTTSEGELDAGSDPRANGRAAVV